MLGYLLQQLKNAGLPTISLSIPPWIESSYQNITTAQSSDDVTIGIAWSSQPTPTQSSQAITIVGEYNSKGNQRRLLDIYNAINALSSNQKTNIQNNLFVGNPALWELDPGDNLPAMAAIYLSAGANPTVPQKIGMTAMYVLDNPLYLVHPSFDTTINIPGMV